MVQVANRRIKHPWFALFLWGGVLCIVLGALTDPFWANGAIPGFMAIYGLSFVFFGGTVYASLLAIKWYDKRGRRNDAKSASG